MNHLMRLYQVDVPLRTQGWINDKLVSFDKGFNIRFIKNKSIWSLTHYPIGTLPPCFTHNPLSFYAPKDFFKGNFHSLKWEGRSFQLPKFLGLLMFCKSKVFFDLNNRNPPKPVLFFQWFQFWRFAYLIHIFGYLILRFRTFPQVVFVLAPFPFSVF